MASRQYWRSMIDALVSDINVLHPGPKIDAIRFRLVVDYSYHCRKCGQQERRLDLAEMLDASKVIALLKLEMMAHRDKH